MLKYIYTEQHTLSMVDLVKTAAMLPCDKNYFFDVFLNFNRVVMAVLMTYDSSSNDSNF